ncbi:MAG: hypothetical protein ACPLXR_05525, partial [Halothiobacillaceae bacterium]
KNNSFIEPPLRINTLLLQYTIPVSSQQGVQKTVVLQTMAGPHLFDGLAGLLLLKYPSIFQRLETVNESTYRICPRFD